MRRRSRREGRQPAPTGTNSVPAPPPAARRRAPPRGHAAPCRAGARRPGARRRLYPMFDRYFMALPIFCFALSPCHFMSLYLFRANHPRSIPLRNVTCAPCSPGQPTWTAQCTACLEAGRGTGCIAWLGQQRAGPTHQRAAAAPSWRRRGCTHSGALATPIRPAVAAGSSAQPALAQGLNTRAGRCQLLRPQLISPELPGACRRSS